MLLRGLLIVTASLGVLVFNRFCAEESLKWWWSMVWTPSLAVARGIVIFWALVGIFLGLVVLIQ